MKWPVNNCWNKLVLKYESLDSIHDAPEQDKNGDVLYPPPLYHFPKSGVISATGVKAVHDSNLP